MLYGKIKQLIIASILVFLIFSAIFSSLSFYACADGYIDKANNYTTAEYSIFLFFALFVSFNCILSAIGNFISLNHDSIVAVATVVVAYFTYTLWEATQGLRKLAVKQSDDMRESLRIAEVTADAVNNSAGWTRELASSGSQSANAAGASAEAAINTIKIMENTAERQLRAYVMVEKAEIRNILPGDVPIAKITIKNSGLTPANNLKQWSNMGFDAFPATVIPPNIWSNDIHSHPLAPGGELYAVPSFGRTLTKEEVIGLQNKKVALYVIGEIRYEDAFGNPRYTKYWLFAGGAIGISTGAMAAYKEGNEYT